MINNTIYYHELSLTKSEYKLYFYDNIQKTVKEDQLFFESQR